MFKLRSSNGGLVDFNLFTKLQPKYRHIGCPYCNYFGCEYSEHGYAGHFKATLSRLWYVLKPKLRLYKRLKRWWTALDYSQIEDVEVAGIDTRDYPDFCDAFIESATYKGREMSETELDRLNEDTDYVYECVQEKLY